MSLHALHIHHSAQLTVPDNAEGRTARLLPLCAELFVPGSVRATSDSDCKLACINVRSNMTAAAVAASEEEHREQQQPRTLVACVTTQPAYLDSTAIPPTALVLSAAAQRLFLPQSLGPDAPTATPAAAAAPALQVELTPLASYALPLWESIQLRVRPATRMPRVLREMPAHLHPFFPLAAADADVAAVRPALAHVHQQLLQKPVFAPNPPAHAQPLLILFADGCYHAVEPVAGRVHGMYASIDPESALYGWGVVGPTTHLSWCESADASARLLDLSVDDLFRRFLPSFEEGLAAAADEELKSAALLLKMFAAEGAALSSSSSASGIAAQPRPPSLLHPRSLLLSGPRGVGKQSFVASLARLLALPLHTLSFGRLILRRNVTGQAEALRLELADLRRKYLPGGATGASGSAHRKCIVVLPSMELTFAAADERDEDALSMHSELLSFLRSLHASCGLFVVGITVARNRLPAAVAKAFEYRFSMSAPSDVGRAKILRAHLGLSPSSNGSGRANLVPFDASRINLGWVVEHTQGFVGADLVSLIKNSVSHASQRARSAQSLAGGSSVSAVKLQLSNEDFMAALEKVHPASLKALRVIAKPTVSLSDASTQDGVDSNTTDASSSTAAAASSSSSSSSFVAVPAFDGVGGLESVKSVLRESLLWPFRHGAAFERLGIVAPKGVLLYGVPGVGKTLLSRTVAREFNLNFIVVHVPDLLHAGVGESEKQIQEMFARARRVAPAVLFLDEVQAVFSRGGGADKANDMSSKLMSELLRQIDALGEQGVTADEGRVFVLAATNLPSALDPSLLRSGRLDKIVYVGPPDAAARKAILQLTRGPTARWSPEVESRLDEIVARTEGFSGVDLTHLVGRAGLCAVQRSPASANEVTFADFDRALENCTSSITPEMIETCVRWGKKFQRRYANARRHQEEMKQAIKAVEVEEAAAHAASATALATPNVMSAL